MSRRCAHYVTRKSNIFSFFYQISVACLGCEREKGLICIQDKKKKKPDVRYLQ